MNDCNKCIAKGVCSPLINYPCKGIRMVCEQSTRKFIEWCRTKGYSCYDWEMLLEQYKEENS